jgi:hypothetical protein
MLFSIHLIDIKSDLGFGGELWLSTSDATSQSKSLFEVV